jgi:hypothetical protein
MAAASCDWVVSHSDRLRYVVCVEDIRFVCLFSGYVSATDVLRAHDYAVLMRVGCLECVQYMRFDVFVLASTSFFFLSFFLSFILFPLSVSKFMFLWNVLFYNTISLFYVYCKSFLISADCAVYQCQELKPPRTKCTFCRPYFALDVLISAAIMVIIV